MEQFNYKNHSIEVHYGYYGKSIYIRNSEGDQIYAHKFTGSAMDRVKMVLGEEEVKAVAVAASTAPVVVRHTNRFVSQPTLTPAQMFQARVDRILQQIAA